MEKEVSAMKMTIAIYPPKDIQDAANSLRKRYDPQYAYIAPHLKIKEPFDIKEDQLSVIVDELQKVADDFKPFSIDIHKVSTFHPTNNVIYLAVKEQSKLMELHNQLNKPKTLKHESKYSFVPHLTIAQNMSDDELHDVYGRLKMRKFHFSFVVERFHLLYQLENGSWTTYETFSFKA